MDSAQIYFLLATSVRFGRVRPRHKMRIAKALRQLNLVRYDPGAENILKRSDVKAMYDEAVRYSGQTAGAH